MAGARESGARSTSWKEPRSKALANPVQRRLGQMGGREMVLVKNLGKFFKSKLTILLKPQSLTGIEIYFSMKA